MQKDKALFRQTLSYSGWDLLGSFSVVAQGQGINMLLNIFFGPVVNAARGITFQVQGAIGQFGSNFMMATRPQIIKYYASGEPENMMNLVFQSAKYSFYLMWILSLPVLLETEYLLALWLKNVPDLTVIFLRIVLVTNLVTSIRNPFIAAMHATGKIKLPALICGTLLISALPISYLSLKLGYPAESVFLITLVITFISMWIEWILVKRTVYFSIYKVIVNVLMKAIIIVLLSVVLPSFVLYYLESGFIRLSIVSCISTLSVTTAVYIFGIGNEERHFIKNKIKTIIK